MLYKTNINKDALLDLLLYAVNEANGWHYECRSGGINSNEMAQCIVVLSASGRHPIDYTGMYCLARPNNPDIDAILKEAMQLGLEAINNITTTRKHVIADSCKLSTTPIRERHEYQR